MESVAGQPLGPYTLIAPLAHGGMGSVYFAAHKDEALPRSLILIKTLKSNLVGVDDYAGRFTDEARVAVRLRHENLLKVTDAGVDGQTFYLAMELIEGITLRRLQSLLEQHKRRLRSSEAAALAVGLLRGLHAAHTAIDEAGRPLRVVHRDVSPHNAMLDVEGRVKVIDYGLATSVLKETVTESMVAMGKSAYMPPEQARGEDVTAAGDQYAAAIVLYELLTGDRFYGDLNNRAIWGIAGSGQHQPRAWDRVAERFRPILRQALSPTPAGRHASCAAFADALVAVEPRAARSEELPGVRTLLTELAPTELASIADARAALVRFDEVTERNPLARNVEATQVVRRSRSSERAVEETASTLLRRREPTLSGPRRRSPLLAAGAAVCVVAPLAAWAALHHPAPPPAPPPALVAAPQLQTEPAVAAPVPAVQPIVQGSEATAISEATAVLTPTAASTAAADSAAAATAAATANKKHDDARRLKLRKRAEKLIASCPASADLLLVRNALKNLDAPTTELATFERTLAAAEESCSQR